MLNDVAKGGDRHRALGTLLLLENNLGQGRGGDVLLLPGENAMTKELRELLKHATKRPWRLGDGDEESCYHGDDSILAQKPDGEPFVLLSMNSNYDLDADAALIIGAMNALPELLQVADRSRALVDLILQDEDSPTQGKLRDHVDELDVALTRLEISNEHLV